MDHMRKMWMNEAKWWTGNLQARWLGRTALSPKAGGREKMRFCASTAAVCIAGAVVLSAAWVALAKRWRTQSRTNWDPVVDNAATRALLTAYLRRMISSPAAVIRSPPLLLLCAAPGEKAPPQAVAKVPALEPVMPLLSLATMSVFLSNLPLLVGVDDLTGELVLRTRDDSIDTPFFPMTMGARGCGWRNARWRREQQAVQEAASRSLISTLLRGNVWGPTSSHDPPLLLLCAAGEEGTPSLRQIDVAQAPTPMPSMSLSSLTAINVFLSSIPMLAGVGDRTKEISILEVPKPKIITSLFLPREEENKAPASLSVAGLANTTLPFLLCDQERGPESLGPTAKAADLQAMTDEDMEVVVATMQLDSPPKMATRRTSLSPSTSSSARESSWNLPSNKVRRISPSQVNKSQPSKAALAPPILWGLPVVRRAKAATGVQENVSPPTSALGQTRRGSDASADPAHLLAGGRGVSGDAAGVRGGDSVSTTNSEGGSSGGGGGTSSTSKRPHTLWSLPGQTRNPAGLGATGRSDSNPPTWALVKAHRCSMSAEITGKPGSTREGEDGTSGDCDDSGVGASTGDREGLFLPGSPLRSTLALAAQASPDAASRGTTNARSSTWALGKARRGSVSPVVVGKSSPSQSDGDEGGRSGCVPTASPSLEVAVVSSGAGTTPPAPRSILMTKKGGPASVRRATAISRGVRWLDIVQKEEQQAISRRKRASRWTGGCRKREGPPTAVPRASRALVFAREGEVAAAS